MRLVGISKQVRAVRTFRVRRPPAEAKAGVADAHGMSRRRWLDGGEAERWIGNMATRP